MSVVAYVRVSTDEQAKNGTSLDTQTIACKHLAESNGWNLPVEQIFREEGESAKLLDRTQLKKMLEFCLLNKGKISHVIIWKVDRLARDTGIYAVIRSEFKKLGIQIVSVTEPIGSDPLGLLVENMMASIAQFDNDMRTVRINTGMKHRAGQGGWLHKAPFGYTNVKSPSGIPTIEPNEEADLVRQLLETFSLGHHSVAEASGIAYELGITTNTGKPLSWQKTRNILESPLYAGLVSSSFTDGNAIKGIHRAIISEETYYKNVAILKGINRHIIKAPQADWSLRGGFLKHDICGNPMTGSAPKGRNKAYPKYHCTRCKASSIGQPVSQDRNVVHAQFTELLEQIRPTEGVTRLFKEIVLRRWEEAHSEAKSLKRKLAAEQEVLLTMKSRLSDAHLRGVFSDAEFVAKKNELSQKSALLNIQIAEATYDEHEKEQVIDDALLFMQNPGLYWNQADITLKRRIQESLLPDGITYNPINGFGTANLASSYLLINKIASKGDLNNELVDLAWTKWNHIKDELKTYASVMRDCRLIRAS